MKRMHWSGAALLAVITMGADVPAAFADNVYDVARARANARAGGPTSVYDADLLARYGALSGTRRYWNDGYYDSYKRSRKKRKARRYRRY